MADGGAVRCLSDLSDDLLRHILFLTPDKKGASTAVLSRRWRWLWRTSGAVFLDSRSFNDECRHGFLRAADKALAAAAADGPIRRLTIFIDEDKKNLDYGLDANLTKALFSNPAARRIEELKILSCRLFTFSFNSLPSGALRVLHLGGRWCSSTTTLTAPPPGAGGATMFPMLVELHLQNADLSLVEFQKLVDGAPRLSTLCLTSSTLSIENDSDDDDHDNDDDDDHDYGDGGDDDDEDDGDDEEEYNNNNDDEQLVGRLLIPAVTTLEVAKCGYGYGYGYRYRCKSRLELDVPMLQYFRYRGHVQEASCLSLKSQVSSNLFHVDLHLTSNNCFDVQTPTRDSFWAFIQNFNSTKRLKIKLDFMMDHLTLDDKLSQDELLGGYSFHLLEQLELETEYKPEFERSMVMLANLLHCCPRLGDLRLKLGKKLHFPWVESSIDKEARVHFDRCVDGFRNRRKPAVSLGEEDDDSYYQALGVVPGLTGEHAFSCLQSHLKRVSLQFFLDEPNCLGVQLAFFFAENAMVLQEMHIDDGCHEMLDHVNPAVRRWIAKTDKGNKQLNVKD